MKYKIPKGFTIGAAFSGPQTEGAFYEDGKTETQWDRYINESLNRFFEFRNVEGDFYHRFAEDIKLAKQIGLNSLRTSIQWARLIPDGKTANPKAVDFYNKVIDEMLKNGIEPHMNLHHFDNPMWLQEKGGFAIKESIEAFAFYAKTAFQNFGKKVKHWITFNEPVGVMEGGYLYDFHYPNHVNIKEAMQVQWNMLQCHLRAVKEYKNLKLDGKICIVLNITPGIPRSSNPADVKAAKTYENFQSKCFLDPAIKNVYPKQLFDLAKKYKFEWETTKAEHDLIADKKYKIDYLGVNYYQPSRIAAIDFVPDFENGAITPHFFYKEYEMPNRLINPYRGWEIYPKALYLLLKEVRENYGNIPLYISENGMGVQDERRFKDKTGQIIDTYRIEFIKEHLAWTLKAASEGSIIFGYHLWTLVDNWSWMNAYKNRYGFIELDLEDGNKRRIKSSGYWIKEVIEKSEFEFNKELK